MDDKISKILQASNKLFQKCGIKSVSMDDIASEMAISKKTLYKFVKDKRHLVELSVEYFLTENKFHQQLNCEGSNAIEQYFMVYQQVIKMINTANFSVEYDLQKYYSDLHSKIVEVRQKRMYSGIKLNIEKGIAEGLYRPEIDVEIISKLNVLLSESMHNYEFLTENKAEIIKIMDVNFDYHIHGIASEKGLLEYKRIKNNINNQ